MRRVTILDDNLKKLAVLENALNINPRFVLNGVGSLSFEIPYNDQKRVFITPFAYVELTDELGAREDLYRVLPTVRTVDTSGGLITVECEHVLATLLDDALPGWHQTGGNDIYTRDAINYVLGFQLAPHWILGDCDFNDQYEYGWQHEKCLTALNGIFAVLTDYKIEYDVSSRPWRLHVRKLDMQATPTLRIAWRYNMLSIQKEVDPTKLATRLYCYGYGEGINQLNIASVNNGQLYIDDAEGIARYGVKVGYFIAREIEDAATLLAAAQAVLPKTARPQVRYTVKGANLFESTGNDLDRPAVGKIVKVYDEHDGELVTFVSCVEGDQEVTITLSSLPDDIANTIAEIADRQRIEQTYAQGATQVYALTKSENATTSVAAILDFYAPKQLRVINSVAVKIKIEAFRAYTQNTSSGGGSSQTSDSGGGSTQTTSTDSEKSRTSGSSSRSTSESATQAVSVTTSGQSTVWSDYQGTTSSALSGTNQHTHLIPRHNHAVTVSTSGHSHSMSHTHDITIPAHAHSVNIPSHSHGISIPNHTHAIQAGVFRHGNPTGGEVRVNGNVIATIGKDAEIDITEYLITENGDIPRGSWQNVSVLPNDIAYITISLTFQGFVQSRGGGTF